MTTVKKVDEQIISEGNVRKCKPLIRLHSVTGIRFSNL